MGSPPIAKESLKFLNESDLFEVVAAVTQPDRPSGRGHKTHPTEVKKYCQQENIFCLSPEKSSHSDFITEFKKLEADFVLVTAFGQILPQKILDLYPDRFINVHASLLPRWRGAAPIQRAVMAGDQESGVCLQVMVKALDAGDLIGEVKTEIHPDESALSLHDRLQDLIPSLLKSFIAPYLNGEVEPQKQDPAQVTYASKIEKSESWIDWDLDAKQIYKNYLGLSLGPGVKSAMQDTSYKFKKIKFLKNQSPLEKTQTPGEIIEITEDSIKIACGKGAVEILEIQKQSKKNMSVREFLKAPSFKLGDRFSFPPEVL